MILFDYCTCIVWDLESEILSFYEEEEVAPINSDEDVQDASQVSIDVRRQGLMMNIVQVNDGLAGQKYDDLEKIN